MSQLICDQESHQHLTRYGFFLQREQVLHHHPHLVQPHHRRHHLHHRQRLQQEQEGLRVALVAPLHLLLHLQLVQEELVNQVQEALVALLKHLPPLLL